MFYTYCYSVTLSVDHKCLPDGNNSKKKCSKSNDKKDHFPPDFVLYGLARQV